MASFLIFVQERKGNKSSAKRKVELVSSIIRILMYYTLPLRSTQTVKMFNMNVCFFSLAFSVLHNVWMESNICIYIRRNLERVDRL